MLPGSMLYLKKYKVPMKNSISWKLTLRQLYSDISRYFVNTNVPHWYKLAVFFS